MAGRPKPIRLALSRRARASLRLPATVRAKLSLSVTTGSRTTKLLNRTVTLRRTTGMRRISRRGLRLLGGCSKACALRARMLLAASTARQIGLRPPAGAALEFATGSARGSSTARRLTLRLRRGYRRALLGAGTLRPTLEAVVTGSAARPVTAKQRLKLRP